MKFNPISQIKSNESVINSIYHNPTNTFYRKHFPIESLRSHPFYLKKRRATLKDDQITKQRKYLQNYTTENNLDSLSIGHKIDNYTKLKGNELENLEGEICHSQSFKFKKLDPLDKSMSDKYLKIPKLVNSQSTINLEKSLKPSSSETSENSETSIGISPKLRRSASLINSISTNIYFKLLGRNSFQYIGKNIWTTINSNRDVFSPLYKNSRYKVQINNLKEADKHIVIINLKIPPNKGKKARNINCENNIRTMNNKRVKVSSDVFEIFR